MRIVFPLLAAALLACGGSSDPVPSADGEPNDTLGQATALTLGTPVVATISAPSTPSTTPNPPTPGDVDYYWFTVPPGGATVRFQTFDQGGVACDPVNEMVDTYVNVYDTAGSLVTWVDDGFAPYCEDFTVALAAGKNYVAIGGWPPASPNPWAPFTYTLKVTIP